MATLCSRYVSELEGYEGHPERLCLIAFGNPKIGNQVFANEMAKRIKENWRFVCEDDFIPYLPKSKLFCSCLGHLTDNQMCPSINFGCCVGMCCSPCYCMRCPVAVPKLLRFAQKKHSMNSFVHVGTEVLLLEDGVMLVAPNYSTKDLVRRSSRLIRHDKTFAAHNLYSQFVRIWIHNTHRFQESDLLRKFIFCSTRTSLLYES